MKKLSIVLIIAMLMSCIPCVSFASDLPTNTKLAEWIMPSSPQTFGGGSNTTSAVLNSVENRKAALSLQTHGTSYRDTLKKVSNATYSSKYYVYPDSGNYGCYEILSTRDLLTQMNDNGFTVSTWVNYGKVLGQNTFFFIKDSAGKIKFKINADAMTNQLGMKFERLTSDATGNKNYAQGFAYNNYNQWYNLTFYVGPSTSGVGDVKVWVNGVAATLNNNGAATTSDSSLEPLAILPTDKIGFAGPDTWTQSSALYLSDTTIYSGELTDANVLALYDAAKDDFASAYDVKVMKDGALVPKANLLNMVEGNVWVEATITDEDFRTEENVYILNKATGEKVPLDFTVTGNTVKLSNSYNFLKVGEYQLVIANKSQTLSFTLTEDTEGRARAVSAVNGAIANPGTDFANIKLYMFTAYKQYFQIPDGPGSDYASILNKNGIFETFSQTTNYTSIDEIITAFNSAIVAQKLADFAAAVAALKAAAASNNITEFKNILLTSYQPIFDLPVGTGSVYASLDPSHQDNVFAQLILANIASLSDEQTVSTIKTKFDEICLQQKTDMEYAAFYAGINSVAESNMETTLTSNIEKTNIPIDRALNEDLYNDYQANKSVVNAKLAAADISTNAKLTNEFYSALTLELLQGLTTSDRAEYQRVLSNYGTKIDGMNSGLLSNINAICTNIAGDSFADIPALKNAIDVAIANADANDGEIAGASPRPSVSTIPGGSTFGYVVNSKEPGFTVPDTSDDKVDERPVETKGFTDLQGYEWAEEYINKLKELGVVNGKTANTFAPSDNVTRFEYVAMLSRAYKLDGEAELPFADVTANHWAYSAVKGAYALGIIGGVDEFTFDGDAPITREAMATIVYRFIGGEAANAESISEYADNAQISDWAVDAVYKMQELGLMNGKDNNAFDPKGLATRAETAALICRLMESYTE